MMMKKFRITQEVWILDSQVVNIKLISQKEVFEGNDDNDNDEEEDD